MIGFRYSKNSAVPITVYHPCVNDELRHWVMIYTSTLLQFKDYFVSSFDYKFLTLFPSERL